MASRKPKPPTSAKTPSRPAPLTDVDCDALDALHEAVRAALSRATPAQLARILGPYARRCLSAPKPPEDS